MTLDLADLNVKAAIAFGIALIAALLTYIAFFKDSVEKIEKRSSKTSKAR